MRPLHHDDSRVRRAAPSNRPSRQAFTRTGSSPFQDLFMSPLAYQWHARGAPRRNLRFQIRTSTTRWPPLLGGLLAGPGPFHDQAAPRGQDLKGRPGQGLRSITDSELAGKLCFPLGCGPSHGHAAPRAAGVPVTVSSRTLLLQQQNNILTTPDGTIGKKQN